MKGIQQLLKGICLVLSLCLLAGCGDSGKDGSSGSSSHVSTQDSVPSQPDGKPQDEGPEFRGVWLSYIELNAMLKDKTAQEVRDALDEVMDNCVSYGLNAVFFHVRANSDAYYKSAYFQPAATAKPLLDAGFDPLSYAVEAAHKRGLALHAWVNPYRIGRNASFRVDGIDDYFVDETGSSPVYWYLPTSTTVQKLILDGIRELVGNYAIDGVQYDDYFYPHNVLPDGEPADVEKAAYEESGGAMPVGDWRRTHVDMLIAASYQAVHSRKGCVFGVSPSHDYTGTREKGYADTVKWLENSGYVDYLCPQIYFGFNHHSSDFARLLEDWSSFTPASTVHLYIGLGTYKIGLGPDQWAGTPDNMPARMEWAENTDILKRSITLLREKTCGGMIFYSYTFFNPDTPRSLASWTEKNGETTTQTYDKEIAAQEVENVISVLKNEKTDV